MLQLEIENCFLYINLEEIEVGVEVDLIPSSIHILHVVNDSDVSREGSPRSLLPVIKPYER